MKSTIKQRELLEDAGKVLDLIEKEDYYIESMEKNLKGPSIELYPGQHDQVRRTIEIKKSASKRLRQSFNRIIKEIPLNDD